MTVTVITGAPAGTASPAVVYSPWLGVEVDLDVGADTRLQLRPEWEYAALGLSGTVQVDGVAVADELLYLVSDRNAMVGVSAAVFLRPAAQRRSRSPPYAHPRGLAPAVQA